MNIYVCDRAWLGANIYLTDTMEEAVEFFRSQYLPIYIKRRDNHNYEEYGPNNPWIKNVEFWEGDFSRFIKVYPIEKGLNIQTLGE